MLFDAGDHDVVVARITSQLYSGKTDYIIADWQNSGLLFESCIRVGKIATVEKQIISRKLGILPVPESKKLKKILREMFRL